MTQQQPCRAHLWMPPAILHGLCHPLCQIQDKCARELVAIEAIRSIQLPLEAHRRPDA